MTPEEEAKIDWSLTTWKGSRLQQHREFYALSFREKLAIAEELADLGRAMMDTRRPFAQSSPRSSDPLP
jgi:hypothetical protein